MKTISGIFATFALVLTAALFAFPPSAHSLGFGAGKTPFQKQLYFAHTSTGSASGMNSANVHAIATDTSLWAIPAGTIIEKVYVMIDTAVTGTTAFTVGDTDSATGFVPAASITLGTPGLYGWSADKEGSYLQSATVFTGPSPLPTPTAQVLPAAKYYSAAGKYLTVTNTTTNTAGALRVVVLGYNVGS